MKNLNTKKSLATRSKTGVLNVNVCCGGARVHRARCQQYATAKANGGLGGAQTAAAIALGRLMEDVARGSATAVKA